MLDDCKGEKFDELLATFSTAVLRKLVTVSAGDMLWNPAMKLAMSTAITPVDYQNMVPLILAHQTSLSASGSRRGRVHEAYDQFSRLLDDKKKELVERARREADGGKPEPDANAEGLARELRANWLGSEEWATAVLDGGAQSSTDSFLELPFSQAWAQASENNVESLSNGAKKDLVVDLEARVLRLRGRLRRWHEFNDMLAKDRGSDAKQGHNPQQARLVFRDHQQLNVASISKAVRQPNEHGRVLSQSDGSFMSTVNEAILHINGGSRDSKIHEDTGALQRDEPADTAPMTVEPTIESHVEPSIEPSIESSYDTSPLQQIENSTLSFKSDGSYHESEPESRPSSPPIVRLTPDPDPVKATTSNTNYNLAERTRKSMSLIPPLPREPAPRPRRGPRPSFPTNQFETPRKSSASVRSGATTPQDQLFEEDAEYASVFKSRPRIAQSPISSPAVHIPGFDEDDEFGLNHDESEIGDIDSPLAASRYR